MSFNKKRLLKVFAVCEAAALLLCGPCALVSNAEESGEAIEISLNADCKTLSEEDTVNLIDTLYEDYCAEAVTNSERISEMTHFTYTTQQVLPGTEFDCGTIRYRGYEMTYGYQTIGERDENGLYPLYIALHGGGSGTAVMNDGEWENMFFYYSQSVENGIYLNIRGIADTWNLHSMDESYYMYDRLIEDMILFEGVDPNRIYLLGFSCGGDGVYQISARMADRFAAVNMSSGHPNNVSLVSLANLPILLQTGIKDSYYDRNTLTVEYGAQLDQNAEKYGFGYKHQVYIHVPEGHNYLDNDWEIGTRQLVVSDPFEFLDMLSKDETLAEVLENPDYAYADSIELDDMVLELVEESGLKTELADTNAVRWVSQYTRNPFPKQLVWDLDTRASLRTVDSFYYLKAPAETTGILTASYDKENNAIYVDTSESNGDFSILFSPLMLNLSEPVMLCVDDMTFMVNAAPSEECIMTSFEETSDIYRVYAAEISYSELLSYAESQENTGTNA